MKDVLLLSHVKIINYGVSRYSMNPITTTKLHTPIVLPQSRCNIEFLNNSHISEPTLELHSRAAPSVRGITTQSVLTQREIPEEGRTEKRLLIAIKVEQH